MKMVLRGKRLIRWLAAGLAGASYLLVFACNSVLIPIPPPTPANPTFGAGPSAGEWSVSTPADPRASGARFYIFNASMRSGLIETASPDGSMYGSGLQGQAGDPIEIYWRKSATDQSQLICRPLGNGLVTQDCK